MTSLGDLRNAELDNPVRRQGLHRLFIEENVPAGGGRHTGNGVEYRGFSGTIGSDQGNDFALFEVQGDIFEGMNLAVAGVNIFQAQHYSSPPRYAAITSGFS